MTTSLPAPGPSFLRPTEYHVGARRFELGMDRPREVEGWWLSLLWVSDGERLASFRDLAAAAGPPPGPPLLRLGPALAGALSGLVLEEDGRQQMRLRLGQPPPDESRPWDAPAVVVAAFRFEPLRVATMRQTELAQEVFSAFRNSLASLGRA